jgi:hypothetical protein
MRVQHLRHAFLVRMDHFDRRLDIDLANLLDPIVDAPVPPRRRARRLRTVAGGLTTQAVEIAVVAEPVPVVASPVGTPS